ncbi:MAG: phosphoribosylamine--glycine ligase [candidate division NC10 bacterium]|nr:phosphoribosylamine--glycine ligase [candidate division NC10 bacterium]MBI2456583.1 phosphoribosylamine--glycine ligase [candidate division NC10 bacterium]
MRVLVIGSGGREHALIWKLKQSPRIKQLFAAPGNAGIAELAECADLGASEVRRLADFAAKRGIDLTVVGPELPLTLGIVDEFESRGLRIFGTNQQAAILEGSKVFAKRLMKKYKIPTGFFQTFYRVEDAKRYIQDVGAPIVVKADGLASGKGAIVCQTVKEALDAVKIIMEDRVFGDAGEKVVVEEFLSGEEASFLAFTDGETVLPMASSQDHKAVFDDDKGPNTGGMGAYSPAPVVTDEVHRKIMEQVMIPTVKAMAAEGRPYRGVLYAGLMIKGGEPKTLEFNARFGDPEAQPLLMRMESDLLPVLEAVVDRRLHEADIHWRPEPAVCVVMAAGGYPGAHAKGKAISGLRAAARLKDVVVFHAGTALSGGKVVTSGGRVLGVTALGKDVPDAIARAYRAVEKIRWEGAHYRTDIGRKGLGRAA